LRFFEEKGHKILPSSSLVPHGDPTLLLTTAGMVQIKPYFLGLAPPPSPRLASCQKCFRTTDIEAVGDTKHLTFFEMLGNFSVGDYFKREAIEWGWEFVTEWAKLSPSRLWITVYIDDDEAVDYWRGVGVTSKRILRYGDEDNFWGPPGDSGPCGPCSEIHYDFGKKAGCGRPDCAPNCDCGRFVELWNLVFTQYNQDISGVRTRLDKPNIDTGLGLERMSAVMQGRSSVFETDLFVPIIKEVCNITGREYGHDEVTSRAIRVVAEHARAIVFLIGDGVIPSNDARGYVLRRILRRAVLFGRRLGRNAPFLSDLVEPVVEHMSCHYPELADSRSDIKDVIAKEEFRFEQTLDMGLNWTDRLMTDEHHKKSRSISGAEAFKLYDTYGFPKEMISEIAIERGFKVDLEGFETEMGKQRERAKISQKSNGNSDVKFITARIVSGEIAPTDISSRDAMLEDKCVIKELADKDGHPKDRCEAGQGEIGIYLDKTPFYAEMGGQVGDTGEICGPNGRAYVFNTTITTGSVILHHVKIVEGYVSIGDKVKATVDRERRLDIARNHTATHLLQSALRSVLGARVHQSGSLVAPDRLRFDFSHGAALTNEETIKVQETVNKMIRDDLPIVKEVVSYNEAVSSGAIALFGEKYGDEVVLVQIGSTPPVSKELCGGSHVDATGQIGFFYIIVETGIGSGIRRIEAVTGKGAEELVLERLSLLDTASQFLQTNPQQITDKIKMLTAELDKERKNVLALEQETAKKISSSLLDKVEVVGGVNLLGARIPNMKPESLRALGDQLKADLDSGIFVLGTIYDERPHFIVMVTPDLVARSFDAGRIVKAVAKVAAGGGGGKPELGQGSGKDKTKIDEALGQARFMIENS
ncbi:MAG: alanine--tRNA ligase, partial [Chloroflexota bacterium]|nr:alanine--tRNA ligase [Chloroflexota bacterium]